MKRFVEQIAQVLGARLLGDGRVEIERVASIESASTGDIVFVDDEKRLPIALSSGASAIAIEAPA